MHQQIASLKREREQLVSNFEVNKNVYRSELKKLNTAIKKFEQGCELLSEEDAPTTSNRGMTIEIENILADGVPRHTRNITAELNRRGYAAKQQSVSAILQIYAKAKKKFLKILPATYMLIPAKAQIDNEQVKEQTIVYENNEYFKGGINA